MKDRKKKIIIKIHTITDSDYFTVAEAAAELEINKQSVRDHLTKGNLKTYKFKSLTLLKKEEVESWKERQK